MIREVLFWVIQILVYLIIAEVIVSIAIAMGMRVSAYHPIVRTLRSVVNPILNPVRRILPPPYKTGGLDFSPMLVIILLQVLQRVLFSI